MSTLLPNYVLACVEVKKKPCCSSIDGAVRQLIHKIPGEYCSPENSGSASTITSSATGPKGKKTNSNNIDGLLYKLNINFKRLEYSVCFVSKVAINSKLR